MMLLNAVWLVLRVPEKYAGGLEIQGVFRDEDAARAAATTDRDVVGLVPLDMVLPDEDWVGAQYLCLQRQDKVTG